MTHHSLYTNFRGCLSCLLPLPASSPLLPLLPSLPPPPYLPPACLLPPPCLLPPDQACCICGGGIRPPNCETRLDTVCADGSIAPEANCQPTMKCGCGSAPCPLSNTSVFGQNVARYSVAGIPGYGEGGFWARGAYFQDDPQLINHRVQVLAECAMGYRAASSPTPFVTNCGAPRAFPASCRDCKFQYSQACRPVACGEYEGPLVTYIASEGPLQSHQHVMEVKTQEGRATALFGETATVTCMDKARAMPVRAEDLPDDACSAPQSFNATCNDNCGWNYSLACQVYALKP